MARVGWGQGKVCTADLVQGDDVLVLQLLQQQHGEEGEEEGEEDGEEEQQHGEEEAEGER